MKKKILISLIMALGILAVTVSSALANEEVSVRIDIKPGSCPNPVNVKSKGVLPVAILGGEDFDVSQIDPTTVQLTYPDYRDSLPMPIVLPLRWSYEDTNRDGLVDLLVMYKVQAVNPLTLTHEMHGAEMVLEIQGSLFDGSSIIGRDVIIVLNKMLDR